MDWKKLKDQNGIDRSGNTAKGNPFNFIIVGIDDGCSFDEIATRLADQRDIDILRYACKDTERLKDELPDDFVAGFEETGNDVDPIHFWQVIDKNGKSLPLVTDGRSRNMSLRIVNERRIAEGKDPYVIEAQPDAFLSKNPSKKALRMKRRRNRHIPDSLAVLAEAAAEFAEQGDNEESIAKEMGVSLDRAKELLAWAPLFQKFCDEARKRANDGRLRLRGAQELVKKFATKAAQEEYFAGRKQMRGKGDASKPPSARAMGYFVDQAKTAKIHPDTLAVLRLATGDQSAIGDFSPALLAAWKTAEEQAAKRPRKAAE